MPAPRLTISPTRTIVALLATPWPLRVPRHRLMRLAMEIGLQTLAKANPAEFRRIVTADAVATAGIEAETPCERAAEPPVQQPPDDMSPLPWDEEDVWLAGDTPDVTPEVE